jgi:RNA polymerase sigma-70 factor (ECF subfamily)
VLFGFLVADRDPRTLPVFGPELYSHACSLKEDMDASSFEQIFESYGPRLRAYFMRHGLSSALADEAAQEVLLSVWHHSERFDAERGSMSAWIFAIARNRLIDNVRRMRRPEPSADDPCWVGGAQEPSPESATAVRGRVESVRDALKSLPVEQLKVLEALYFEGQSMSEYADASGTPLGTVKTRARLALRALRGRMPEGGEE